ncbi:Alpha/Beta hydrolase protein [Phaeosphaeria sp. MPI-PUGE-AT-0046c]|nr:Alpha/Beta hydrolase protein [Phaeosphaeria sp. MPI-PUGE-AT-0046c]
MLLHYSTIALIVGLAQSTYHNTCKPICEDLTLHVDAKAQNFALPPYPPSTDPRAVGQYLSSFNSSSIKQNLTVSGTFAISATYCRPAQEVPGRETTIQLLLHGVGYTKEYWSGIGFSNTTFPGQYSWAHHATSQGYSTLAIDNLGNGQSDHPDPISVVQLPLQLELIRTLIGSLRSGNSLHSKFNKVILVAHSYGTLVARAMATLYPDPKVGADAYILTASSTTLLGFQTAGGLFKPRAASVVTPSKFGHLPPAYVQILPASIREIVYSLSEEFDPEILALDIAQPHVFAVGELATFKANTTSNFEGPVMYLTGRTDAIVCDKAGNITVSFPDCGVGRTSNPGYSRARFPKANPFGVYVPQSTGHNMNLHFSAGESFGAAHEFLDASGF